MSRSQSLLSTKGENGEGGEATVKLWLEVCSLPEVDGDSPAPGAMLAVAAAGAPTCNPGFQVFAGDALKQASTRIPISLHNYTCTSSATWCSVQAPRPDKHMVVVVRHTSSPLEFVTGLSPAAASPPTNPGGLGDPMSPCPSGCGGCTNFWLLVREEGVRESAVGATLGFA
jgi:hypothetical protein